MKATQGLFKYLDASKLIFFEKRLLLLTPPKYLNDPWDFLPKGRIPSEDETLKIWLENEKQIARSSAIALPIDFAVHEQQNRLKEIRSDFTSKEFLAEQGKNYQNEMGKSVGITSLTELPACRLMWAHYAQSYTGFVVELAAGEIGNFANFVICGMGTGLVAVKVKYPPGFKQIQIAEDAGNVLELCCTKHPSWKYEEEWRIIAPLRGSVPCRLVANDGREEKRFCVRFKPENIRRVIFGMRMHPETKKRLCTMLAQVDFQNVVKQVTDIDHETGKLVLKSFSNLEK